MDEDGIVKCSRKVMIQPDTTLKAISENQYDVIVLPGGGGGAKVFCQVSSR